MRNNDSPEPRNFFILCRFAPRSGPFRNRGRFFIWKIPWPFTTEGICPWEGVWIFLWKKSPLRGCMKFSMKKKPFERVYEIFYEKKPPERMYEIFYEKKALWEGVWNFLWKKSPLRGCMKFSMRKKSLREGAWNFLRRKNSERAYEFSIEKKIRWCCHGSFMLCRQIIRRVYPKFYSVWNFVDTSTKLI